METKATSVHQEIGTMHGQRGIQFSFVTAAGTARVVFDFYGNGREFNGAPYKRIEAAAVSAVVRAGHEVKSFTHFIIH